VFQKKRDNPSKKGEGDFGKGDFKQKGKPTERRKKKESV